MAIGWISALKVIPWGDVIDAAPGVVKSARKIFTRSQQADVPATSPTPAEPGTELSTRVAQLESSVAQMSDQQQATARLIETLAEQNARIVQAIDVLRLRTRLLAGTCGVLVVVALVAVVAWSLR